MVQIRAVYSEFYDRRTPTPTQKGEGRGSPLSIHMICVRFLSRSYLHTHLSASGSLLYTHCMSGSPDCRFRFRGLHGCKSARKHQSAPPLSLFGSSGYNNNNTHTKDRDAQTFWQRLIISFSGRMPPVRRTSICLSKMPNSPLPFMAPVALHASSLPGQSSSQLPAQNCKSPPPLLPVFHNQLFAPQQHPSGRPLRCPKKQSNLLCLRVLSVVPGQCAELPPPER